MTSNFTSDDLARMDSAIAQGVRKVTFADGRTVEYSTFQELVARRNFIEKSIGTNVARTTYRAKFTKGVAG